MRDVGGEGERVHADYTADGVNCSFNAVNQLLRLVWMLPAVLCKDAMA